MPVTFSIAPSWILLCALLSVAVAFFLYRKKIKQFENPKLAYLLAILRGLSVFIMLILLMNPFVRREQHDEIKPSLVFMQDQSASIKAAFKQGDSNTYRNEVSALLTKLAAKYTVKEIRFGTEKKDTITWQYNQSSTNISQALVHVVQDYEADNLQAIILASDGLYNDGASPLQMPIDFPGKLYTVALGDTTSQRDLAVNRVFANKMVYLNDRIAVKTDFSAMSAMGEILQAKLIHVNTGKTLQTQTININQARFMRSLDWIIPADNKGIQHFRVRIEPINNEANIQNNSSDFFVEVLDGKENILVLYQAPHPDIQAIKEALRAQRNYEIDVLPVSQTPTSITGYDLIILHNLPSNNFPISNVLQQAKQQGIGLWFIVGLQSNLNAFNKAQTAVSIQPASNQFTDFTALPNKDFTFFNLPNLQGVESLPPLTSAMGKYQLGPNAQMVFKQQIGQVRTDFPLWVCQQDGDKRIAILCGEGLWRWRLEQFRAKKNTELVDALIANTARFAATRQDSRPFRVVLPKNIFYESDFVQMDAELVNENKEAVNTPDVNITIKGNEENPLTYTFSRNNNAYTLPVGRLAAGHYTYEARTVFNGKTWNATGSFEVQAGNLELANVTADWSLLNQLALRYDGNMVTKNQLKTLEDSLLNANIPTVLKTQVSGKPLIDYRFLFAILLLLFSLEWFLRKRSGQY